MLFIAKGGLNAAQVVHCLDLCRHHLCAKAMPGSIATCDGRFVNAAASPDVYIPKLAIGLRYVQGRRPNWTPARRQRSASRQANGVDPSAITVLCWIPAA